MPAANSGGVIGLTDRDHDGVCDSTELAYESDPDRADTDRDGLPDFTELVAGFNPTDPTSPNPDQIAYIAGEAQAALDFVLRMTVEGNGVGYTGEFRDFEGADLRGLTAKDFFEAGSALDAEPPDNVRGMQVDAERFESVLGKTRLTFMLRFKVSPAELPACTIGYPFEYRVKSDSGHFVASRDYLLIAMHESAGERSRFCVPEKCY